MTWDVLEGDCVEVMRGMDEASVDAVVTDPPYGLEFMGKEWDRLGASIEPTTTSAGGVGAYAAARVRYGAAFGQMQRWHHAWSTEALRVLKPGGHLLSFGGTRTYHRLTCALEDAGFEIHDCLAWLYGSGFPKSLDVSKAIDKAAGAEREVVGEREVWGLGAQRFGDKDTPVNGDTAIAVTAPATPDAVRWQGWGTALKPAFEPIVVARKPLSERNVAANVQRWGTGALNVDGCRVDGAPEAPGTTPATAIVTEAHGAMVRAPYDVPSGRWPANVLLDPEAAALLDEQTEGTLSVTGRYREGYELELGKRGGGDDVVYGKLDRALVSQPKRANAYANEIGGASRFFYTAKTSRAERERGVRDYGGMDEVEDVGVRYTTMAGDGRPKPEVKPVSRSNHHPTVKPVDLMQWLCRLVTPPGGTVLDPFVGSGSTGIAALREGFSFIGIEREPEYVEIARARIIGDAPLFNMIEGVS